MRRFDRFGNLREKSPRFVPRDRAARDALGEGFSLDELRHEKRRAFRFLEAVKGRDAGMVQLGE